MTLRTASRRTIANRRTACRRRYTVVEAWRMLVKDLFDPYRPELHYMRGPGPKWHEKHSQAHVSAGREIGEFARAAI
jgi:hypothetical protein